MSCVALLSGFTLRLLRHVAELLTTGCRFLHAGAEPNCVSKDHTSKRTQIRSPASAVHGGATQDSADADGIADWPVVEGRSRTGTGHKPGGGQMLASTSM